MPPWLQITLLAAPALLWAAGAAIRLYRLPAPISVTVTHLPVTGRTIKANWSVDTKPVYVQSKEAYDQLVAAMTKEIALQIDDEVCKELFERNYPTDIPPCPEPPKLTSTEKLMLKIKAGYKP